MSNTTENKEAIKRDAVDVTGWSLDSKERCDLYHRVRVFPPVVAEWRKQLVENIRDNQPDFFTNTRECSFETLRARLDDGITLLKDVAQILTLLVPSSLPISENDIERFVVRFGLYQELGLSFEAIPTSERAALIRSLLPPTLRNFLLGAISFHAKNICIEQEPSCEQCELKNFCTSYRAKVVARAEASDSPTTLDLFSGAGGLSEGFRRAGFRSLLTLDLDESALKTYRINHPEVPDDKILCRDIRTLEPGELKRLAGKKVDVLLGAPPCQGFSTVGFRSKTSLLGYRVSSDERNYLYEYMVGAALELKPEFVLMENVPGMQSTTRKENLSFLDDAAALLREKGGYKTAIWKLTATAYGVPQDRTRCFLVASKSGLLPALPGEEYQNTKKNDFDTDALPPVTLEEAIFDLPVRSAGSGAAIELWERTAADDKRHRRYLKKFNLLSNSKLIFNHTVRYHNERDLELYALLKQGEDSVDAVERYNRTDLMRYRCDVFDDKYSRLRANQPSRTIVAHLAKDGNGYIHPTQTRSISIREAARIQSFRDDYIFCGSPSDQWVQIGNAVPPVLAEVIAKSILRGLKRGKGK
jgi:DNA (cytosine-5)-methyltransferase 1